LKIRSFVTFVLIALFCSLNLVGKVKVSSVSGETGLVNISSPLTLGKGRLSFALYSIFGATAPYDERITTDTSPDKYLQTTSHLSCAYGVIDKLDMFTKVSFAFDKKSDSDDEYDYSGVNKFDLGLKYSLIKNKSLRFGAGLIAYLPVSSELKNDDLKFSGLQRNFNNELLYSESTAIKGYLSASFGKSRFKTTFNLGYLMRTGNKESDAIIGGVGFSSRIDKLTTLFGEFYTEYNLDEINYDGKDKNLIPMKLGGGARFGYSNGIILTTAAYAGISEESPQWQICLGVGWSGMVTKPDSDNDGVIDSDDRCPDQAEDFDGFEDSDGCPDPDNDNDGILDDADKCPGEAEDLDGFEDSDGCPELDNDNDGVLDAEDKCPNEAEDKDGYEDLDGCPEIDNDQDGMIDDEDGCPNEAEDMDGYEDEDGCPDYDNDRDGVSDENDKCPNEAENINGFEDGDGCPDSIILRKGDKFKVENIYFKSGSDVLTKNSYPALEAAKKIFDDYPTIKIQIEGHTDNVGDPKYNLVLSQKRANSVMKYLVDTLGVYYKRLKAVGFGEEHSVEDNSTKIGRAKNRRIEFKVLSVK